MRHRFGLLLVGVLFVLNLSAASAQNLPGEVADNLKHASQGDLPGYLRSINMELAMAGGDASQQREIIAYALILRKDDVIESMAAASMVDGQFRDAVDTVLDALGMEHLSHRDGAR